MQPPDSVIIAVGSPPGRSVRGMVRLSGAGVFDLLAEHITDAGRWTERGVHRARLHLANTTQLPCLLVSMPAPGSYTGEDAVEVQLPGNTTLLERVIDVLIARGKTHAIPTRRAEPGEFTARAFFRGRLTLPQAEGVAAVISARSDAELRAARLLVSGALGTRVRSLADELLACLALVEAGIDFTDQEDVVAITPEDLHTRLSAITCEVRSLLEHARGSEQVESIPWVVLSGAPNAGKSTLFNALLGRERAVVSPLAGTTRDVLSEPLAIETGHGLGEVMLVDVAGRDEAETQLETQMQDVAAAAFERAELILAVRPVDELDAQQDITPPAGVPIIQVRTKHDLVSVSTTQPDDALAVSAVTGHGINDLRAVIANTLADRAVCLAGDALVLRPRHIAELRDALHTLQEAIELSRIDIPTGALAAPELVAAALHSALNAFGSIVGQMTPDDVLDHVFASFCIGK